MQIHTFITVEQVSPSRLITLKTSHIVFIEPVGLQADILLSTGHKIHVSQSRTEVLDLINGGPPEISTTEETRR